VACWPARGSHQQRGGCGYPNSSLRGDADRHHVHECCRPRRPSERMQLPGGRPGV